MEKADQVSNELSVVADGMGVERCSLGCISILVLMVMLLSPFSPAFLIVCLHDSTPLKSPSLSPPKLFRNLVGS